MASPTTTRDCFRVPATTAMPLSWRTHMPLSGSAKAGLCCDYRRRVKPQITWWNGEVDDTGGLEETANTT